MRAIGICWTWNCFQINISFYSKRAAQSENFRMKSQVLVDLVSEKEIISSHFNEFWLWQFKITAGHGQNTRGVISKQHSIQYEFHFHAIASIDTFEIHSIGYWMAAQVQEYKFSFDRVKRFQKPIRFDWIARKAEYWGGYFLWREYCNLWVPCVRIYLRQPSTMELSEQSRWQQIFRYIWSAVRWAKMKWMVFPKRTRCDKGNCSGVPRL